MVENEYWNKEEFEDLIAHALIGLYETEQHKHNKRYPKEVRVSDKELMRIRNFGAYFYPIDRIMLDETEVDLNCDFLPKQCAMSDGATKDKNVMSFDWLESTYFSTHYMERVSKLPGGLESQNRFKSNIKETFYSLIILNSTIKEKLHIQKSYVTIDNQTGKIFDTVFYHPDYRKYIRATQCTRKDLNNLATDTLVAAAALNFYLDSRFLWNVSAIEGITRATFGVYPEQIKSLFYAREMPMSETGRKKPILHWVAAHQRRIKSGIDIDIEKHLRGINEFVYNGTKFKITKPIK